MLTGAIVCPPLRRQATIGVEVAKGRVAAILAGSSRGASGRIRPRAFYERECIFDIKVEDRIVLLNLCGT